MKVVVRPFQECKPKGSDVKNQVLVELKYVLLQDLQYCGNLQRRGMSAVRLIVAVRRLYIRMVTDRRYY